MKKRRIGKNQVDVDVQLKLYIKSTHKTTNYCNNSDKGLTVQPYLGAAQVGQVPHSLICPCESAGRFACAIPSFLIPPAKCNHI